MGAARRRSGPSPSLFPFLSVLLCLIGTLMFLAIAVIPRSLEQAFPIAQHETEQPSPVDETPPPVREPSPILSSSTGKSTFTETAKRDALPTKAESTYPRSPGVGAETQKRNLLQDTSRQEGPKPTSFQETSGDVEFQIEDLLAQHEKQPIVLECSRGYARSLDGKYTFAEKAEDRVLPFGPFQGTPFTGFLERLAKSSEQEYVLFLVRPEGVSVFKTLRAIIVRRNEQRCRNSVPISEDLTEAQEKQLPKGLSRRLKYERGQLSVTRVMTAEERDALKAVFRTESAKRAVDWLYRKFLNSPGWIDYGTELIPHNWKIAAGREMGDAKQSPAIGSEAKK